jgi:hypothetical protein
VSTSSRRPARLRLLLVLAMVGSGLTAFALTTGFQANAYTFPSATPKAVCGPGSRPETSIQGRVPAADYTSGRAAKGYTCNAVQVSHQGSDGGYKVLRYRDPAGHTCAFYDSTLLFPKDALLDAGKGLGVVVLGMADPRHPRKTAQLTTPAMLTPHESVLLNARRGLLAAVAGTPATQVGIVDLYDVHSDCRHPRRLSSTPTGIVGHESGFAPDGRTFYAAGAAGGTLTAIDVSNPRAPRTIFVQGGDVYHGLRLSPDGRTMYVANIGYPGPTQFSTGGLRILDVSDIQDRRPNPQVHVLSDLKWPEHSIPQAAQPFTRNGHKYLLEVDEFANFGALNGVYQESAPVGAARIINVDNPRRPHIVSDLRLRVHQPAYRAGAEKNDPGAALPVQGYAAHYCSVPTQTNPRLAACSMILSGLRVFDIADVRHPREVAYFNKPTLPGAKASYPIGGAFAMSQPAWDVRRHSIWYTDANAGFFDVRLTNGAWPPPPPSP